MITLTGDLAGEAELWQRIVTVHDADVLSRFGDGFAAGGPAVTCRRGTGSAWYVATQPTTAVLDEIVARVLDDAGVTGLIDEPTDGVEAVRRGDLMFLFNHTTRPVMVSVGSTQHSVDAHGCTYHEYIP